jgi:hypothetical protein
MATYKEAHQVRIALKMKLSQYCWYTSSTVVSNDGDYSVVVVVKKLDNQVRKIIPPVVNGISVRTDEK